MGDLWFLLLIPAFFVVMVCLLVRLEETLPPADISRKEGKL